jgi:deltex-like protein
MQIGQLQGQLPKETLWVDLKNNPGPLVVQYKLDNKAEKVGKKQNAHIFLHLVTYLPDENNERNKVCPPKFAFACGATFEMIFSRRDEGSGQNILLPWSDIFDSTVILERVRNCAEKHCKKCSSCRKVFGRLQKKIAIGVMPSGTMRIDLFPNLSCRGYDEPGTIVISYRFERGTQKSYHECPGQPIIPTYRVAYLPSNEEGRDLLKRLKFAFSRGLTFDVGTSLTTGLPHSITWLLPHKTTLDPGPFGYPDPSYFATANEELDHLGVPAADELR